MWKLAVRQAVMQPAPMPKFAVPIHTVPDGAGKMPRAYIVKLVKSVTKFMVAQPVMAPQQKAAIQLSAQIIIITAMKNAIDFARLILITTKKSAAAVAPVLAVGSLIHGQAMTNVKNVKLNHAPPAILPLIQATELPVIRATADVIAFVIPTTNIIKLSAVAEAPVLVAGSLTHGHQTVLVKNVRKNLVL